MVFTGIYEQNNEKVFVIRDTIEVRVPIKFYSQLKKKYTDEEIVSIHEPKVLRHHYTGREMIYITKESGIPLIGHTAFGLIDRGTNLIQVRPVSGCNLNCIFCSVDEGVTQTRKTDYIVDTDHLVEEFAKIAALKGNDVEAHIDGQGEPFLYPYMVELLEKLRKVPQVKTISAQSNGMMLDEEKIRSMDGLIDRINLSISSMDERRGYALAGTKKYSVEHVKNVARMLSESSIDVLLAPVWVPGYNDEDIPRIIEFGLEIGAGKKFPAFGIQNYVRYQFGKKVKGKAMRFPDFFDRLAEYEKAYGIKLKLSPSDFGIHKSPSLPKVFKKGEKLKLDLIAPGRVHGEMLAVERGRVIGVLTDKPVGTRVNAEITRITDNVYVAVTGSS
ncbi:radical SAM protein [Methanocella sp. CWC-04]|uniref:Radical SAM protein n=1 Tax=Methanooceanicella nereidis TaxID=2052831 RepID=A0AAP2RH99_9EURY|nr:radical SAM protein [Methanocella sp. CWC-04]MCD1296215.1 radical SAM protein [Methanocella sp. CWC-04]